MRITTKVIAGLAFAGLAATGSAALTGSGLTSTAGAAQFVGGTVSQTISGATLSNVAYGYADAPANTEVNTITLSFTDTAVGPTVAVTPAGNANGGTFACTAVAAESSTCSYTAGTDTLAGYTGLTGITITVA
jgi:hypothetical protein